MTIKTKTNYLINVFFVKLTVVMYIPTITKFYFKIKEKIDGK